MSVLADVLPADWQILWVTRHGRPAAERWCREQRSSECGSATRPADWIEVASHVDAAQLSQMRAAIVATSPHTHADWLQRLLRAQVPTLCEKPLALDPQQAAAMEHQAVVDNCPVGVNLELHYATYLEQFARLVSELESQLPGTAATIPSTPAEQPQASRSDSSRPRHVELLWLDPWSEVRYGETKYSDVYTNIVDDMFPHCWSVLRHVTSVDAWGVEQVEYLLNSDVQISLVQGNVSASIILSRRAPQRRRRLSVRLPGQGSRSGPSDVGEPLSIPGSSRFGTSSYTAELDFSPEPGFILQPGQRHELQWDGERPLTRSLKSFLEVVAAHRSGDQQLWQSWPLSIVSCRQSVQVSTAIAARLHRAQQRWLDRCLAGDRACMGTDGDAFRQRLWFDMFVPIAAAAGQRVEFTDPQQLQTFFDSIAQLSHRNL